MAEGIQISRESGAESIDVTGPDHGYVSIEVDEKRGVLYVNVEGRTVLRICRWTELKFESSKKDFTLLKK